MYILAAVVTCLIPLASASIPSVGFRCNSSNVCPEGSSCVEKSCFDCKVYPIKCLRSVEICNGLGCGKDEECYLQQEADNEAQTVAVKAVCAKTDPCSQTTCPSPGWCTNLVYGNQPPVAKCQNVEPENPCRNFTCENEQQCYVKEAYAYGVSSSSEAACADVSACKSCNTFEYCELQEQPDGSVKGVCLGFYRNFYHFGNSVSFNFPPV